MKTLKNDTEDLRVNLYDKIPDNLREFILKFKPDFKCKTFLEMVGEAWDEVPKRGVLVNASTWESAKRSAWASALASVWDSAWTSTELLIFDKTKDKYPDGTFIQLFKLWKMGLCPVGVLKNMKFVVYVPSCNPEFPNDFLTPKK